ncbi:hypothetical protein NG798_15140 [Ancylothrix sp. C2]|uniref:hypothetical protein n=1 Tax=Ancylothrix sp. D3o TaxID=2953691 RepID=UPI0021BBB133|nr:hypothetical protein [Ancylothrix sp. D3o]MCT7951133.1 hypothetical protein [Ancylothrix sp. D3o]
MNLKCLFLGGVMVLGFGMPSFAQSCTGAAALQTNCQQNSNEIDTVSGAGNGQLNMMELIHRAQMGAPIDMQNFTEEQKQNINSAADAFRTQQMQRLEQSQQQETGNK